MKTSKKQKHIYFFARTKVTNDANKNQFRFRK
jgi:hypothetical protein